MNVKCFLIEPTGRQRVGLRRYRASNRARCPLPHGYHDTTVWIGEELETRTQGSTNALDQKQYLDDPRWPAQCACGYPFDVLDEFQVFVNSIYRRADDHGVEMLLRDAPPGAMWNAEWMSDHRKGPDGKCLYARCPGGQDWCIDGRASNCDSPCANCRRPYHAHNHATQEQCPQGFKESQPHKCWVRHGVPPELTVDKAGVTCGAGAGSIITDNFHGFLRNGIFVAC
jgi:hypothetical protein